MFFFNFWNIIWFVSVEYAKGTFKLWSIIKYSPILYSLKPIFGYPIMGTIANIHGKWVHCPKIVGHLLTWTMFWNFWILLVSNFYFTFVAETDMKIPKKREIGIVTGWNIWTPSTIPTHKKDLTSQTSEY